MKCMHHRLCVVMQHHLHVIGKHRQIPLPCLKVLSSQVHEGCVVACAMTRRLGPIFNAANDAVEQGVGKTSLAEPGTRRRLTLPETVTDTDMFNRKE